MCFNYVFNKLKIYFKYKAIYNIICNKGDECLYTCLPRHLKNVIYSIIYDFFNEILMSYGFKIERKSQKKKKNQWTPQKDLQYMYYLKKQNPLTNIIQTNIIDKTTDKSNQSVIDNL